MGEIITIDIKNKVNKKYIRSSWIFISLSIIIAIKGSNVLSYFESIFSQFTNSLIPGLLEFISYTLLSAIAGLIFYQLNNLISQRVAR